MNNLRNLSDQFTKSLDGIKTKIKNTSKADIAKYGSALLLASTLSTGINAAEVDSPFNETMTASQTSEMSSTLNNASNAFDTSLKGAEFNATQSPTAVSTTAPKILASSCEGGAFYDKDAKVVVDSQNLSSIESNEIGYNINDEIKLYASSLKLETLVEFTDNYPEIYNSLDEDSQKGYSKLTDDGTGYTQEVINHMRNAYNYSPKEGLEVLEQRIDNDNEFTENLIGYDDARSVILTGEKIPENYLAIYAEDIDSLADSFINGDEINVCSKIEYNNKVEEIAKRSVVELAEVAATPEGENLMKFIDANNREGLEGGYSSEQISKLDALNSIKSDSEPDSPSEIDSKYDKLEKSQRYTGRAKAPNIM